MLRFAPPYEELSRFANSLATCLEAGVGMERSLESSVQMLAKTRLGDTMPAVVRATAAGEPLSDAMSVASTWLPPFFLPMIQAGEETGRLDEALRYLEHHCLLLAGPSRDLRNLWLIPLLIAIAGSAIQALIFVVVAPWSATLWFLFFRLRTFAILGLLVWVAHSKPVRPIRDRIALALPGLRWIERDMAINRFFHAMSMLYAAAGHGVDEMIRLASKTTSNTRLRADFVQAAEQIERKASMPKAFQVCEYVTQDAKDWIGSGDLTGTLESVFERISKEAADRLAVRLAVYHEISVRLMMALVIATITATVISMIRFP